MKTALFINRRARILLLAIASLLVAPDLFAWPDLVLTKTGPAVAAAGDLITYTLAYTNKGAITASSVTLKDLLPAELTAQTNTLGSGTLSSNTITWYLGSIAAKKGGRISFQARVSDSAAGGQYVTNQAVISTPTAEYNTNNNFSAAQTLIVRLTPLTNQTACAGDTVVFSTLLVAGGYPYTFQWYHDATLLTGQTNSTLVLTNVSTNDAGIYTVTAKICGLTLSRCATLTVNPPVIIDMPLMDQSACPEGTAVFTVHATGVGLTYEWFKDSMLLPGETTNMLVIDNVSPSDAGVYRVIVSGACGNAATNEATLTVDTPVSVQTPPEDQSGCVGSPAVFDVTAIGTGIGYQWYHGAILLVGETTNLLVLTNVSELDAGVYSVVVTGACGGPLTNSATLTVDTPVTIKTPPADQTVVEGSNAVFTVDATGTDLSYQWYFNGAVVGTGSELTLDNVSTNQAGTYTVVVGAACGLPVTNTATLTVNVPVTVITPPVNQVSCPGGTAVFNVIATGTGLSYQWLHETNLLANQIESTLILTNVGPADAGLYSVVVTGVVGPPVTNSATLMVNSNIVVTTSPVNQTNCPGTTAVFEVDATGSGLTYQWFKSQQILPGQTNSILTLTNLIAADAAVYTVLISGECGEPVSRSATLALNEPVGATPLVGQTNCPGTTAVFSTVASGTGPYSYQWLKDGNLLVEQTGSSLTLTGVGPADAGLYSVIVSGACGSVTNSATLTINTPVSATALLSQTNCAGTTVAFSTVATGTGPFSYAWFRNGQPLEAPNSDTLILENVSTNDAGTYSVIVGGACGSVTNAATLTVLPATSLTPLANQVHNPGETAVFSTTASGTGPFTFVWKKDGVVISGQTGSSLILSNLTYASDGTYTVEATGACGTAAQSASLHINLPPAVSITYPTNGTTFIAPANFTVSATATDPDGTITNVVFFLGTNQVAQTTMGNPYDMTTNNVPAGTYTFRARATDNGGLSTTSAPVTVMVVVQPPLSIIVAMHLNLQTGLFEQTVRVTNPTFSTYNAVRVYVSGISSPITVYNASGTTNGIPYVQSNQAVAPGTYVDLTIEYYVPVGGVVPNPTLTAELVPPASGGGAAAPGTLQHISRGLMLANQTYLVEFVSVSNRTYQIQYTSDLKIWKGVQPLVTGNGTSIQWIDNGQPKTDSSPASQPYRFYRVVLLP